MTNYGPFLLAMEICMQVAQAIYIIAVKSFCTYKWKYAMACWAKDSCHPYIIKGRNIGNPS